MTTLMALYISIEFIAGFVMIDRGEYQLKEWIVCAIFLPGAIVGVIAGAVCEWYFN